MLFKVRGILSYTKVEICDCKYCQGHDGGEKTYEVDRTVEAVTEDGAKIRAEIESRRNFDTDEVDPGYDWTEGPFIEPCGEDVQMRRMGQPELFPA